MDDFTNYVLSGVLTLAVWGVGALVIRANAGESVDYVNWLKIWALTAAIQAVAFSLALGAMFPSPTVEAVEESLTSSLTNPEGTGLSPEVLKELEEATATGE
jgi:hypothetical protein